MIAYPRSVCDPVKKKSVCDSILYSPLLVAYLSHYSEFSFDMPWPEIGDKYLCNNAAQLSLF